MENKTGSQERNQNAWKHGYYAKYLTAWERKAYKQALLMEGLDEEIALLRVKIMSLVKNDPDNVRLITQAINSLVRMLVFKYNLDKSDKDGIAAAVGNVLKDIAIPAGIGIVTGISKL